MGLFSRKKPSDKVDYDKLNELIGFSRNFMKFIFSVSIVALVVLITYICKEWKVFGILGDILSILSPFFIGIILAWLLDPIVEFFQKKGVKRGIGATFVYVLLLVLLFVLGRLLIPTLIDQVNEMINGAPELIKSFTEHFDKFTRWLSRTYNIDGEIVKSTVTDVINNVLYSITVDGPSMFVSILSGIVSGGIDILLGILIGFYMLLDFDDVKVQLSKIIPNKHREEITELTENLNKTLRRFVYGTLLVMFILFICQSIGMSIAGITSPLVFALFCAITNIIPYLGPYLGGAPAVLIGFTISPSVGVGVLISVLVCQLLESYLLTPVIQSKTMKLHPVTIIIGLLLFSHFFGIIGMLFATPVIACGKIIINFLIEKYNVFDEEEVEEI